MTKSIRYWRKQILSGRTDEKAILKLAEWQARLQDAKDARPSPPPKFKRNALPKRLKRDCLTRTSDFIYKDEVIQEEYVPSPEITWN